MNRLFSLQIDKNIIKVDYNYNLGHDFGESILSPDNKFNFINISKNASSTGKTLFGNLHWTVTNFNNLECAPTHLAILRDPTERWMSGIAEFLVGNCSHMGECNKDISLSEVEEIMDNKMFQNLLFDFVIFDGHTIPQCCYLQGLDINKISFFTITKMCLSRFLIMLGHHYRIYHCGKIHH